MSDPIIIEAPKEIVAPVVSTTPSAAPVEVTKTVETPAVIVETPVTPKAGEEVKAPDFDSKLTLDSFLEEGGTLTSPKPVEAKKVEVTPKTSEAAKEVKVASDTTKTVATPVTTGGRDFTGIEESDIPHFKQMSNAAFEHLKPRYLKFQERKAEVEKLSAENTQLRQGKVTLPESYYQHKDAFVLTPEFGEISGNINQLSAYQNHWEQQLLNIKSQKDWQDLEQDPVTKQWGLSKPKPSTPEAEMQVMRHYNGVSNLLGEQKGRLQQLQATHQTRWEKDNGEIEQATKQYFGYLDDDKSPLKPTVKIVLDKFPPAYRNSPVARLAAYAITAAAGLDATLRAERAGKATEEAKTKAIEDATRRAGPTLATINNGGPAKASGNTVTLADFQKELD